MTIHIDPTGRRAVQPTDMDRAEVEKLRRRGSRGRRRGRGKPGQEPTQASAENAGLEPDEESSAVPQPERPTPGRGSRGRQPGLGKTAIHGDQTRLGLLWRRRGRR